jgi:hypothetical protein
VHVQVLRYGLLDLPEETQELLMPVAGLALCDHLSSGHIQRCKQGGGAVTDVVMRHPFHIPQAHGQQRLGPIQGLNLRLFVDAEHHRLVGRVQVQADDVADLFDEERIRRQFECLLAVGLHREGL